MTSAVRCPSARPRCIRRRGPDRLRVVATAIPAGTYKTDGVHSTAGFAVKHMIVSTFRGRFDEYAAALANDVKLTTDLEFTKLA